MYQRRLGWANGLRIPAGLSALFRQRCQGVRIDQAPSRLAI